MVKVKPTENKSRITVKSNNDTSVFAIKDNLSEYYAKLSERWASSPDMVNGADYSSKYYAEQSKNNANKTEILKNATIGAIDGLDIVIEKAKNDIEQNRINSIDAINDTCSIALGGMYEKREEVLTSLKALKAEAENSINNKKTTTINDIEFIADGEKKEIEDLADLIKENAQDIASRTSFAMFDTVLKDHILTYKESKGLALQGTYVYKEAIAGSRYGYPDFYNKCLEEYNNSKAYYLEWEQPIATAETTTVDKGDIIVTASTAYASWNPYLALNGIATTATQGWALSTANTAGWWQVKFPYKIKITGFKYYRRYSNSADNATTGRFYTSADKNVAIGNEFSVPAGAKAQLSIDIENIPVEGIITDTIYLETQAISGQYGGMDFLEINAKEYTPLCKNQNGHFFYNIADKEYSDNIFQKNGTAWFYGIDTENERIFLPRNNYFEQTTGDVSEVGQSVEAGLPNIEGTFQSDASSRAVTGVFGVSSHSNSSGYSTSGSLGSTTYTFDASLSSSIYGNSDTVQPNAVKKLLYICVGNTVSESAVTDVVEVTTSENDTTPLFTGMYFDFTPNNVSWLKAGEQKKSGDIYAFCYNELVKCLNEAENIYNLKVINESDMIEGVDYSEYWKINQDEMTFTTPTAISNKALSGAVAGNGMTLGLTNGTNDYGLVVNYTGANNEYYLCGSSAILGASLPSSAGTNNLRNSAVGITTDETKSGIIAEQSTSQLYFKVANAVQNLELLDAGEVLEAVNNIIPNNSELIASYGLPDYSAGISLTASSFPFTASTKGVLYFTIFVSSSATNGRDLTINGNTTIFVPSSERLQASVLMDKGDVASYNSTATTFNMAMFYPLKGVN